MSNVYTPEMDVIIREMWADPSVTADQIGARLGRNKNQIIGRVHRLKLPLRGAPASLRAERSKQAATRRTHQEARMQTAPKPSPAVALSGSRTCQWIEGDPADLDFCGEPALIGKSYCPAHAARCFVTPSHARRIDAEAVE